MPDFGFLGRLPPLSPEAFIRVLRATSLTPVGDTGQGVFAVCTRNKRVWRAMATKESIVLLNFEVLVASIGVVRYNFDWSYGLGFGGKEFVANVTLRDHKVVQCAPGGTDRIDQPTALWRTGVEHFGFTAGTRDDVVQRTTVVLETIARLKLVNWLDDGTRRRRRGTLEVTYV